MHPSVYNLYLKILTRDFMVTDQHRYTHGMYKVLIRRLGWGNQQDEVIYLGLPTEEERKKRRMGIKLVRDEQ